MTKADAAVRTRPLKTAELTAMRMIWKRSGLPYRPKGRDSMPNLRKQLRENPQGFLGAFVSDKLVGVVLVSDDGRKGWINRLAVLPEARGQGVARRLITEAEDILRKRGRRLFCVQIEDYNLESMEFFERAGYKREDDIIYFTKRELRSY